MSKSTAPKNTPPQSTAVIELRQAADLAATVNGDFQTVIKPFNLMPGDSVVLKTAVIDTTETSLTKVVIPEDLTLTVTAIPYVVNYQYTNKTYLTGIEAAGTPTSQSQPDYERYFACSKSEAGDHRMLNYVRFKSPFAITKIPAFNFTIQYNDPATGDRLTYPPSGHLTCPTAKAGLGTAEVNVTVNLPISTGGTNPVVIGIPVRIDPIPEPFAIASFNIGEDQSTGGIFSPMYLSADIPLSKGSYNPSDICSVINDSLNTNSAPGRILQAPFLQSSGTYGQRTITMDVTTGSTAVTNIVTNDPLPVGADLESPNLAAGTTVAAYDRAARTATLSTNATGTGTNITVTVVDPVYMVKENFTVADGDIFTFENSHFNSTKIPSLFGSSQLQLTVDPSSNKMMWKYLHTPYYDPESGVQSVKYQPAYGNVMSKLAAVSGVAISSMTAKVTLTSEVSNFWTGQLGFGETQLNAGVGSHIQKSFGSSYTDVLMPVFSNIEVSTTTQYIGADTVVQKKAASTSPTVDRQFYAPTSSGVLVAGVDADATVPIVGPTPYTQLVGFLIGYFKIEIEGIGHSEVVSSTGTSRTIQAIVSRYYTDGGNFCSAGSDSGIVYTHTGSPQTIASLRCRILNPDNTLANVGPDNTVFLEVLKN